MHICDKKQYGEASGWERIKLGLRLTWCKITQQYSSNNSKLTASLKEADIDMLKPREKEQLEAQFKEALNQHKNK